MSGSGEEKSKKPCCAIGPSCNKEPIDPIKRDRAKVGRNDPCICGSQKKFKKCCGKQSFNVQKLLLVTEKIKLSREEISQNLYFWEEFLYFWL